MIWVWGRFSSSVSLSGGYTEPIIPGCYIKKQKVQFARDCTEWISDGRCSVRQIFHVILLQTIDEAASPDSDPEQASLAFICKRLRLNYKKLSGEEMAQKGF